MPIEGAQKPAREGKGLERVNDSPQQILEELRLEKMRVQNIVEAVRQSPAGKSINPKELAERVNQILAKLDDYSARVARLQEARRQLDPKEAAITKTDEEIVRNVLELYDSMYELLARTTINSTGEWARFVERTENIFRRINVYEFDPNRFEGSLVALEARRASAMKLYNDNYVQNKPESVEDSENIKRLGKMLQGTDELEQVAVEYEAIRGEKPPHLALRLTEAQMFATEAGRENTKKFVEALWPRVTAMDEKVKTMTETPELQAIMKRCDRARTYYSGRQEKFATDEQARTECLLAAHDLALGLDAFDTYVRKLEQPPLKKEPPSIAEPESPPEPVVTVPIEPAPAANPKPTMPAAPADQPKKPATKPEKKPIVAPAPQSGMRGIQRSRTLPETRGLRRGNEQPPKISRKPAPEAPVEEDPQPVAVEEEREPTPETVTEQPPASPAAMKSFIEEQTKQQEEAKQAEEAKAAAIQAEAAERAREAERTIDIGEALKMQEVREDKPVGDVVRLEQTDETKKGDGYRVEKSGKSWKLIVEPGVTKTFDIFSENNTVRRVRVSKTEIVQEEERPIEAPKTVAEAVTQTSSPEATAVPEKEMEYNKVQECHSKDDFEKFIGKYKIAIVKFGAGWCVPCQRMQSEVLPVLVSKSLAIMDVNTDNGNLKEIIDAYRITSLPTTIIFKNKVPVARYEKFTSSGPIIAKYEELNKSE